MLNHKEKMPIRLENVDKPESIVDLEEIWFFKGNRGGNHLSVFSLMMRGRRENVYLFIFFQKRKLKDTEL